MDLLAVFDRHVGRRVDRGAARRIDGLAGADGVERLQHEARRIDVELVATGAIGSRGQGFGLFAIRVEVRIRDGQRGHVGVAERLGAHLDADDARVHERPAPEDRRSVVVREPTQERETREEAGTLGRVEGRLRELGAEARRIEAVERGRPCSHERLTREQ